MWVTEAKYRINPRKTTENGLEVVGRWQNQELDVFEEVKVSVRKPCIPDF
jgi:hypothetical protein